jgi:choline-glycine betaine transporter
VVAGLIAIVWVASALAVLPVLLGVNWGIRRFSELGFIYSMFIVFMVFFMEDSWYLFNLLTQTIGYYLFYIIRLGSRPSCIPPGTPSSSGPRLAT